MLQLRPSMVLGLLLLFGAVGPARVALAAGPGEARQGALDAAIDPRLAQVAPLAAHGEPLGKALRTLEERTGVKLEAAPAVADLKVTLLARDLSLQRGLAEVAKLLELVWLRRGSAPNYRYSCERSHDAMLRGRALLEEARAANRGAVQAQLQRVAEAFRGGDLEKLAATDPSLLAALKDPERSETLGALRAMAYLSPDRIQQLVQTGRLTTTYDQMPPSAKDELRRALESFVPMALGRVPGRDGNSMGFETFLKSTSYSAGLSGLDYGDNTYYGEMKLGGFAMRFKADLGTPTLADQVPAGRGGTKSAGLRRPGTGGAPARAPSRPTLSTAKLGEGRSMSVREITEWLAEKASYAVIADYYATRYEQRQIPVPAGASVETVLTALERHAAVQSSLADDGRVIQLRSQRWPLDDLMEPPPAVVEALERALKTKGQPGLEEYLLTAQLTDAQLAGLIRIDGTKYASLGRAFDGTRPLLKEALRLTAALSPAQRAAAASSAGLPAVQLSPLQRTAFTEALTRQQPGLQPAELAGTVFFIQQAQPAEGRGAAPGAADLFGATGSAPGATYSFRFEIPGRPPLSASLAVGPQAALLR